MGGTREGGLRTAATNKARYGEDYYVRLGARGGRMGRTGGFYVDRQLAREAGRIGGAKSRRPVIGTHGRLTDDDARDIRGMLSDRTHGIAELARLYGVTVSSIRNIHDGKSFKASYETGCICQLCEIRRRDGRG